MKTTAIIVEYNPLHNGHLYHLKKARELSNPDCLVAIMSGNVTLRGDVAIADKFARAACAVENGVDLVVELPYQYVIQNAYTFANGAIMLAKSLKADTLVFGSETNNLAELQKYAELEIDVTHLKTLMRQGLAYPKAYGLLCGALYPNDILAVAYLKALKGSGIKPVSIQRTSDYHSDELKDFASATALRKALKEQTDISAYSPMQIKEPVFTEAFYPLLRTALFSSSRQELQNIFMVSEGIEKLLKDNAYQYDNYHDFLKASISKRYTASRIQRICANILFNISKQEIAELPKEPYLRVLAFNGKGRKLLKELKKNDPKLPIVTTFKKLPSLQKELDWKVNSIYALATKNPAALLKRELQGPYIMISDAENPEF